MNERHMTTAATEAIRIAEKYLPDEPLETKKALAMEIVDAINLSEAEFSDEITRRLGIILKGAS